MISVKSEPLSFDTDEQSVVSSCLPELEVKKLPCPKKDACSHLDAIDQNNNSSRAASMQVTKYEASENHPNVDLNFDSFIQRYSPNQKDDPVEISSDEYTYTPTPITDLVGTSTDPGIHEQQKSDGENSWKRSLTVEEYQKLAGKSSGSTIMVMKPYHCDENGCNGSFEKSIDLARHKWYN